MAAVARLALALLAALLMALPAAAEPPAAALIRAMQVERLVGVMAEEGIAYGRDVEGELFPGAGGARWSAAVAAIHDPARMTAIVTDRLNAEYADAPEAAAAAAAFFSDDRGQRIVGLEIGAREALLDPDVKDAARVAFDDMRTTDPGRVALIDRFVAANDLVEQNVAGAMNANLAFWRGLRDGGAPGAEVPEADVIADLWAGEAQVRSDMEDWVFPYLGLAYAPLEDADIEAYIAFSLSPEGRRLNAALFAAFDALFAQLSHDLGKAAALVLQGQDL